VRAVVADVSADGGSVVFDVSVSADSGSVMDNRSRGVMFDVGADGGSVVDDRCRSVMDDGSGLDDRHRSRCGVNDRSVMFDVSVDDRGGVLDMGGVDDRGRGGMDDGSRGGSGVNNRGVFNVMGGVDDRGRGSMDDRSVFNMGSVDNRGRGSVDHGNRCRSSMDHRLNVVSGVYSRVDYGCGGRSGVDNRSRGMVDDRGRGSDGSMLDDSGDGSGDGSSVGNLVVLDGVSDERCGSGDGSHLRSRGKGSCGSHRSDCRVGVGVKLIFVDVVVDDIVSGYGTIQVDRSGGNSLVDTESGDSLDYGSSRGDHGSGVSHDGSWGDGSHGVFAVGGGQAGLESPLVGDVVVGDDVAVGAQVAVRSFDEPIGVLGLDLAGGRVGIAVLVLAEFRLSVELGVDHGFDVLNDSGGGVDDGFNDGRGVDGVVDVRCGVNHIHGGFSLGDGVEHVGVSRRGQLSVGIGGGGGQDR
jgi:hypothetical protein